MPDTTPPQTASPIRTPTPPPPTRQVAEAVLTSHGDRIELRLDPEELGKVRLTLRQEGEVMRVHLQAERPETLDLLRRHAPELAMDLRSAGYGGASFSFGGSARGQPDHSDPSGPAGVQDGEPPPARRLPLAGATLDLRL